jgi:S-adenosylmethionine:tRNA ribosyltransferase-isomerase
MSALAPATWPGADPLQTRLLHLDPARGVYRDARLAELATLLRPGDLVVLNDAATLPASLVGWSAKGPLELRLAGPPGGEGSDPWPAVLFGAGSWRERTEDRRPPPRLDPGDRIELETKDSRAGRGLAAEVVGVSPLSPRLVELRFDREGEELWSALFRVGRPVQYSYLSGPLPLWHVQTPFAARPLAVEMPSAGRALRVPLLRALAARGVALRAVTHAAGLSSTGDPTLDAALPLPELSLVPEATVAAVERTRAAGGRVVAVGTTVVRALEGAWREGSLRAGAATIDLRIGPGFAPRAASGLLTGLHEPGESHFALLQAFAPRPLLEAALAHAARSGYLGHEFGDLSLILPGHRPGRGRLRPTSAPTGPGPA